MICGRLFNVWVNLLLALFLYGYSNKDSKRDAIITSKNIIYIYMFSLVFRVGMKEEIILENAQSAATSLSMKLPKCDLV